MGNFLKIQRPPKLNQKEMDNLNKPINRNEIVTVISIEIYTLPYVK